MTWRYIRVRHCSIYTYDNRLRRGAFDVSSIDPPPSLFLPPSLPLSLPLSLPPSAATTSRSKIAHLHRRPVATSQNRSSHACRCQVVVFYIFCLYFFLSLCIISAQTPTQTQTDRQTQTDTDRHRRRRCHTYKLHRESS